MLEMILFAMGLADIDENDGIDPSEASDTGCRMSVSEQAAVQYNASESEAKKDMSAAVALNGAPAQNGPPAQNGSPPEGRVSAPASPCVTRRPPQTLGLDPSRIPQPLASPTPLRRSGSLRVRGEKLLGFGHSRISPGRGLGLGVRTSPGATFPSITEASESWRKSLRGGGDPAAHGAAFIPGPANSSTASSSTSTPISSNLRQQRHHRSLQSLSTRPTSRDTFPHTPTPSPEDVDFLRINRFLLDHAKEFSGDHDDLDSLRSYGSNCSTQSACDHAQFARNGTTFSGRRMKYIVHCSSHPEPNEYLTPTQRANQQLRRLKALLEQAKKDIEAKDDNIFKLTKEVVELRLLRDEVDGSPAKFPGISDDSRLCRVAAQLENENGNSTSLSDSGHFDDVLSLTSAQSVHSPGPRHLVPSPESERLAEAFQRKIDDVTRKQGEKSLEDRKSLVEMYEKKMEDMSRKAREKFLQEKNDLIEMYEKKIGDILKRHQEKVQEKTLVQKACEKKIEDLSQLLDNQISLQTSQHSKSAQDFSQKLEDAHQLLETAHKNAASLNEQLNDANLRYYDLQQELFQSREGAVILEAEVETLHEAMAVVKQQLSEKQVALVQTAQIESELNILRRHVEEQNDTLELKSQLESELARVLNRLREEEQKCKEMEHRKTEVERLLEEKQQEASKLKSHLEGELSKVLLRLKEEEEKSQKLQHENAWQVEEMRKCFELKTQLESDLVQVSIRLKEVEENNAGLRTRKAEIEALYEEEQEKVFQLQCDFQNELVRVKDQLNEEGLKNRALECGKSEMLVLKEEECSRYMELIAQLERDLVGVKHCLSEEEERNKNLEHWMIEATALKEEIVKHAYHEKNLTEQLASLESEVDELKNSLLEKKESSQMLVNSTIQNLEEKLRISQKEAVDQSQLVHQLKDSLAKVESDATLLSNLLSVEKHKNEELLLWKSKAEKLELEIRSLQEEIVEKNQQLQYLSSIESEAVRLQEHLTQQKDKIKELILWKTKAEDLEEEMKSLREETTLQIQNVQCAKDLSENNVGGVSELLSTQQVFANPEKFAVPIQAQQQILFLEAEVEKLKESLDQSCWIQSEKETMRLEMEKRASEQTSKIQKLEEENSTLNESISKLKDENEGLIAYRNQQNESGREEVKLNVQNVGSKNLHLHSVVLENREEIGNTEDIVSQLREEIDSLRKALTDQEDRHTEMNLKMYLKGQEAAKFERKDQVMEMAAQAPEKVSIPELLSQLAETEKELEKCKDNQLEKMPKNSLSLLSASEAVCLYLLGSFKAMYRQLAEGQANSSSNPEATLLFLKSAFYYFLTDEANCQGHLHAIQSILGFTESEKQTIDTLTYIRR